MRNGRHPRESGDPGDAERRHPRMLLAGIQKSLSCLDSRLRHSGMTNFAFAGMTVLLLVVVSSAAELELISQQQSPYTRGLRTSFHPGVSADGRFVIYES